LHTGLPWSRSGSVLESRIRGVQGRQLKRETSWRETRPKYRCLLFGNGGKVGPLSAATHVQTRDRLAPHRTLIRERQREPLSASKLDLA
jgi:hypothetical protein